MKALNSNYDFLRSKKIILNTELFLTASKNTRYSLTKIIGCFDFDYAQAKMLTRQICQLHIRILKFIYQIYTKYLPHRYKIYFKFISKLYQTYTKYKTISSIDAKVFSLNILVLFNFLSEIY